MHPSAIVLERFIYMLVMVLRFFSDANGLIGSYPRVMCAKPKPPISAQPSGPSDMGIRFRFMVKRHVPHISFLIHSMVRELRLYMLCIICSLSLLTRAKYG